MGLHTDLWNAIKARVGSLPLTPMPPVAWPNLEFTKPPGTEDYLEVFRIPNTSIRLGIGSDDPHQHRGIIQVSVFKPKKGGSNAGLATAEIVAAHFPCDLILRSGSTDVRITKDPDIAQEIATDTHWLVPVSIEYEVIA